MDVKISKISIVCIFVFFLFVNGSTAAEQNKNLDKNKKVRIGWLEKVYLSNYNFSTRAKIDTGAKNSSLHATDMEFVYAEGQPPRSRIRFKTEDTAGNIQTIEAEITREVKIRRSSLNADSAMNESRVEIELDICLAGVQKKVRINLSNREGMNYRMILGRTALEGTFIVDPGKTFLGGKKCRTDISD